MPIRRSILARLPKPTRTRTHRSMRSSRAHCKAGVRPIAPGADALVSPVDGTVSQLGEVDAGRMLQAKGIEYTAAALLGSESAAAQYADGRYACLYLAPYDYHRIHMPCRWRAAQHALPAGPAVQRQRGDGAHDTRTVCASTSASSASSTHASAHWRSSWSGRCSSAASRRCLPAKSIPRRAAAAAARDRRRPGLQFRKGDELGRFNMGSTVVLLWQRWRESSRLAWPRVRGAAGAAPRPSRATS